MICCSSFDYFEGVREFAFGSTDLQIHGSSKIVLELPVSLLGGASYVVHSLASFLNGESGISEIIFLTSLMVLVPWISVLFFRSSRTKALAQMF